MKNLSNLIIPTLLVLMLFSLKQCHNSKQDLQDLVNLNLALQDTLRVVVNKDSSKSAFISVIQAENGMYMQSLQSKDVSIQRLQKLLKEKPNSSMATIVDVEGQVHDTVYTNVTDSSLLDTTRTIDFVNQWYYAKVISKPSITTLDLVFKEEYDITINSEFNGLFKPRKEFIEVKSKNPFVIFKNVKSYVKTESSKRYSIGPFVGYGINLQNFNPAFVVGLGINYSLIKF
jgi:hypothetical protein